MERWVCKVGGHNIIADHSNSSKTLCTREVLKLIQQGDTEDYELVVDGHFSNHGEPNEDNINEVVAVHYICPIEHKSF